MSDLIPISEEQAKLGQEVLKTLRATGEFFSKALGSTPEDLIAYLGGDWLRVRRAENLAAMMAEARERLKQRCVEDAEPAPLTLALPLFQAAADENREELRDVWSRLLAAAMDPKRAGRVRQSFITAVKAMDPLDAKLLRRLQTALPEIRQDVQELIRHEFDVTPDEIKVSWDRLEELKCVGRNSAKRTYVVTAFGNELNKALQD